MSNASAPSVVTRVKPDTADNKSGTVAAASSESVADFAIFLILATFRNLQWCTTASLTPSTFTDCHTNAAILSHNPRGHTLGFLYISLPAHLHPKPFPNKPTGIIGLGNIGHLLAQKAFSAFGMTIHYHDIIRKPTLEGPLDATYHADLNAMLALSDCVVLATPASPDGRQLIDGERIKHFKIGSRFINIARGSLVSSTALADALDAGILIGCGLDVHEHEPAIDPRLIGRRNVTLTAHNAGGTLDTHIGFESLSMKNITAVLTGQAPLTPVNLHFLPSALKEKASL
ncbi:putative Glyoxylate reductase [Glarea lozoyensis 74030]|uniref:Putative Glyoxylate reductase n=1 Tax=Glarea lozoyensis (strain ATCC 74030 / MF5533) TaxID=1104152 RepID=H0EUH1_GLAL7|nr:putative Glyoxylate reductase [Glarea lozoyensis 74030]